MYLQEAQREELTGKTPDKGAWGVQHERVRVAGGRTSESKQAH